jgi:hypothetical protein
LEFIVTHPVAVPLELEVAAVVDDDVALEVEVAAVVLDDDVALEVEAAAVVDDDVALEVEVAAVVLDDVAPWLVVTTESEATTDVLEVMPPKPEDALVGPLATPPAPLELGPEVAPSLPAHAAKATGNSAKIRVGSRLAMVKEWFMRRRTARGGPISAEARRGRIRL